MESTIANKFLSVGLICVMVVMATACPSQTWLQIAQQDLPILAQEAQSILAIADPADAALATKITNSITAGLKLVSDAVAAYQASPNASNLQKVAAALDQVGVDIPAVLQGINFSNPVVGAAITSAVMAIVATLDIIAANLPAKSKNAARSKRMASRPGAKNLDAAKPDAVRARWNADVCAANPKVVNCPKL